MPFEKNLKRVFSGTLKVNQYVATVTSNLLYIAYEKGQKLKIWILFLQWSKCIPINLKGTLRTCNGKFEGFRYPTAAKCEEITIFDQKQPFET